MADLCRSCGAFVEWVQTENSRAMPIDPKPREDGNLVKVDRVETVRAGRRQVVAVVSYVKKGDALPEVLRYVSHFATCTSPPRRSRK